MTIALSLVLTAAPFADLAVIDREVALFAGAEAEAMPLDPRLRLRPCRSPLALSWRGGRRETIVAECPDAGGWRLFVPMRGGGAAGPGAAPAVNRGDAVTIAVSGPGFSVSQPGEALEAGAPGAWIRVRGLNAPARGQSAQPLRAQVVRPGLVSLALP